jgi:hypothetical protein
VDVPSAIALSKEVDFTGLCRVIISGMRRKGGYDRAIDMHRPQGAAVSIYRKKVHPTLARFRDGRSLHSHGAKCLHLIMASSKAV